MKLQLFTGAHATLINIVMSLLGAGASMCLAFSFLRTSNASQEPLFEKYSESAGSTVLHRNLNEEPPNAFAGRGNYIRLSDGREVFDAAMGAAVASLGYGRNKRVKEAMDRQWDISYVHSLSYGTSIATEFTNFLVESTHGHMARAVILSSGSDTTEAAIKLAFQYWRELPIPQLDRVNFIAREQSYHGTTLGALALSGHRGRRTFFKPLFPSNFHHVSACNPYHDRNGMSDEEYVEAKAKELEEKIEELGPQSVAAFVAEPVVGAALGAVTAPKGYFKAMKAVCDKYDILFILDEVMCGMGRTGTLHAWEQEDVVPDIQMIGKGLGGGYAPVAAMLIGHKVNRVLENGSAEFRHGHTYQNHPLSCAAALEVQKIVRDENLLENVRKMGDLLKRLLEKRLSAHRYVGRVDGKGLFLGIEFVRNKITKEPFDPSEKIAWGIQEKGVNDHLIKLYYGTGTKDGYKGDHELIAPAYTITEADVHLIVDKTVRLIEEFFNEYDRA